MRLRVVLVTLALLVACGPAPGPLADAGDAGEIDGGADGPTADMPAVDIDGGVDLGPDMGRPCTDEGSYMCLAETEQCCGGYIIRYYDGPCFPTGDAGVPTPDCAAHPTSLGCPCATPGMTYCAEPMEKRLSCTGGVWAYDGHACCP